MELRQRRIQTTTSFAFGETELAYTFRQGPSVREVVFDYFDVARDRKFAAQRDWDRLQLGLLLTIAGVCLMVAQARMTGFTPFGALWVVPGVALLGMFTFIQSHFLVVQAGGNSVWIIDDQSTRTIVAEIDRRRRDRIANVYGPLNLANEPYLEIRKIEWLVDESVLTREEADSQIASVNAAAAARVAAREEVSIEATHGMFSREAIAI